MIDIFLFQLLRNPDLKSVMFWVTAVVYCLLLAGSLAGKWRLFEKAGRVPWHCLVPFLGNRDLYDICWDGRYGIIVSALYLTIELTVPATGMIPLFSIRSAVLFLAFIGAFVLFHHEDQADKIVWKRRYYRVWTDLPGRCLLSGRFQKLHILRQYPAQI